VADIKYSSTEFGPKLAEIRHFQGLNQTEMAFRLGVSRQTYRNYENGERDVPAQFLVALWNEFGVDPNWFLQGGTGCEPAMQHLNNIREISIELEARLAKKSAKMGTEQKWELIEHIFSEFLKNRYGQQTMYRPEDGNTESVLKLSGVK